MNSLSLRKQKKRAQTEAVKTSLTEPDTGKHKRVTQHSHDCRCKGEPGEKAPGAPTEGKVTLGLCICLKGFNSEEKTR